MPHTRTYPLHDYLHPIATVVISHGLLIATAWAGEFLPRPKPLSLCLYPREPLERALARARSDMFNRYVELIHNRNEQVCQLRSV